MNRLRVNITYRPRSLIIYVCSYGKSDVEVAVTINRHQLHVREYFLYMWICTLMYPSVQVLVDIDYYKNRMQILALRPAPIQVEPPPRFHS
jgi:predicted O-linked N-acetylglucosamine transferase (SPINDLY family)